MAHESLVLPSAGRDHLPSLRIEISQLFEWKQLKTSETFRNQMVVIPISAQ